MLGLIMRSISTLYCTQEALFCSKFSHFVPLTFGWTLKSLSWAQKQLLKAQFACTVPLHVSVV